MAATKIQRHARTRIKSMRTASRTATMSRAATRVQAQQRGKISRKISRRDALIAEEDALISEELQRQEEGEKWLQEELDMMSRV